MKMEEDWGGDEEDDGDFELTTYKRGTSSKKRGAGTNSAKGHSTPKKATPTRKRKPKYEEESSVSSAGSSGTSASSASSRDSSEPSSRDASSSASESDGEAPDSPVIVSRSPVKKDKNNDAGPAKRRGRPPGTEPSL
jgi:hypothetical protein